mmetsp:Transcript_21315/g.51531  ORF Transcript_21315/g.51531 Transcript_21315/m.51531 type:complete len:120 (-) Transcript_21315:1200-1559(-)
MAQQSNVPIAKLLSYLSEEPLVSTSVAVSTRRLASANNNASPKSRKGGVGLESVGSALAVGLLDAVGSIEGENEVDGDCEGTLEGRIDGSEDGWPEGWEDVDGCVEGCEEGWLDGRELG